MDKRIVIAAYKRGIITIQECAQILGLETAQMRGLINDPQPAAQARQRQPAHG